MVLSETLKTSDGLLLKLLNHGENIMLMKRRAGDIIEVVLDVRHAIIAASWSLYSSCSGFVVLKGQLAFDKNLFQQFPTVIGVSETSHSLCFQKRSPAVFTGDIS